MVGFPQSSLVFFFIELAQSQPRVLPSVCYTYVPAVVAAYGPARIVRSYNMVLSLGPPPLIGTTLGVGRYSREARGHAFVRGASSPSEALPRLPTGTRRELVHLPPGIRYASWRARRRRGRNRSRNGFGLIVFPLVKSGVREPTRETYSQSHSGKSLLLTHASQGERTRTSVSTDRRHLGQP